MVLWTQVAVIEPSHVKTPMLERIVANIRRVYDQLPEATKEAYGMKYLKTRCVVPCVALAQLALTCNAARRFARVGSVLPSGKLRMQTTQMLCCPRLWMVSRWMSHCLSGTCRVPKKASSYQQKFRSRNLVGSASKKLRRLEWMSYQTQFEAMAGMFHGQVLPATIEKLRNASKDE